MNIEIGHYSPIVKIGLVGASRNCFPRSLAEKRTAALFSEVNILYPNIIIPEKQFSIIESIDDAKNAAQFFKDNNCDAAILYLGNFSPEIEDAVFVKNVDMPVLLLAAAEEDSASVASNRGDALCGLISASLAIANRGLLDKVTIPANPLVDAKTGAREIFEFSKIIKTVKGVSNSTIGLFGPRPRDFESCNYNTASLSSIGVEVEEMGLLTLKKKLKKSVNHLTSPHLNHLARLQNLTE